MSYSSIVANIKYHYNGATFLVQGYVPGFKMVAWGIVLVGITVAYLVAGIAALIPVFPPGPGYFVGSFAAGFLAGDSGRGARYGTAVAISGAMAALIAFLGFQVVAFLGAFGSEAAGAAAHVLRGVLITLTIPTLTAVAVALVLVGGATLAGLSAVVGAAGGAVAKHHHLLKDLRQYGP